MFSVERVGKVINYQQQKLGPQKDLEGLLSIKCLTQNAMKVLKEH